MPIQGGVPVNVSLSKSQIGLPKLDTVKQNKIEINKDMIHKNVKYIKSLQIKKDTILEKEKEELEQIDRDMLQIEQEIKAYKPSPDSQEKSKAEAIMTYVNMNKNLR